MVDPQQDCPEKFSESTRLIVVLENAFLETVKVRDKFELLSCDKHQNILRKSGRDPALARPDIVHQCLLMLLDSPLNQTSHLEIFIRTQKNILIQINPRLRIPRTFDRFAGLMVQLLHKFTIKATGSNKKLLHVIKNPITNHLPSDTSWKSDKALKPRDLAQESKTIVIAVGAMAHGSIKPEFCEEGVSISQYPLSAALACAKLCTGFEEAWQIN